MILFKGRKRFVILAEATQRELQSNCALAEMALDVGIEPTFPAMFFQVGWSLLKFFHNACQALDCFKGLGLSCFKKQNTTWCLGPSQLHI